MSRWARAHHGEDRQQENKMLPNPSCNLDPKKSSRLGSSTSGTLGQGRMPHCIRRAPCWKSTRTNLLASLLCLAQGQRLLFPAEQSHLQKSVCGNLGKMAVDLSLRQLLWQFNHVYCTVLIVAPQAQYDWTMRTPGRSGVPGVQAKRNSSNNCGMNVSCSHWFTEAVTELV